MRLEYGGSPGFPMPEPDRAEVFRYLGYRNQVPDETVGASIEKCIRELSSVIRPCAVWEEYPLEVSGDDFVRFGEIEIRSRHLCRNLARCGKITVMAATLGVGPDRLIARASVGHVSEMVILQAASAAMIEAWCDTVNEAVREDAAGNGLYCRPRFSPGYGDFPLEFQKDILALLDAPKRIGITLTESFLMAPSKSVTAVIGESPEDRKCPVSGCDSCGMKSCAYRRG